MQNSGEDRRARGPAAAGVRLSTNPRVLSIGDVARAGQVIGRNVVTLPAWFPAAKARAVLRLKGMEFALIGDACGAQAAAHADDLAAVPSDRCLGGCAIPLGPAVSETMPIDEALRVMEQHAALYVPVVLGGVVLGVLSRAAATKALATEARATEALTAEARATTDGCAQLLAA